MNENEDWIILNQDYFVENLTPPYFKEISSMKKGYLLPKIYKKEFIFVVSKLNTV